MDEIGWDGMREESLRRANWEQIPISLRMNEMRTLQERGKGHVWFYGRAIHPYFPVIFFVGPFSESLGNEGALGEHPLQLHEMLEVC